MPNYAIQFFIRFDYASEAFNNNNISREEHIPLTARHNYPTRD